MKYDFDKIIDRSGTGSLKWDRNHRFEHVGGRDGINSLWVADMDFPCAKPIVDAMAERAMHPIYGYTYFDGSGFFELVARWNERRYGWKTEVSDILYAPGVVYAIACAINAFSKPGQGVVIQTPVYYPFRRIIEKNGRVIKENPLKNNGGKYLMDYEGLREIVSHPDTTLMILCSPHNPVGRVWSREELKAVCDICRENKVLVLSDEIHADLIRKESAFTPAAVAGDPKNTLTFNAPSKSFNVPGLMASTVVIENQDLKSAWKNEAYSRNGMSLPNPMGLAAASAAYKSGEDWLAQVNEYIDENLRDMKSFIDEHMPSVGYEVPEGTYLAWLDFRDSGYPDDSELSDVLFRDFGILVDPGSIFGEQGKGYIRINAACPRSRLIDALEKMHSFIK
jgi:cystathionine beta-lyase